MLKVAILDDYQNVSHEFVDLKKLSGKYEFKIFSEPFVDEADAIEQLSDFEALLIMRERTPITKNLIDNLIATKPDNYELIKWGWAPDIETAREDKLTELGKPEIRGLPAVIYNRQAWKETYGNDDFVNKKQQW